VAAIDRILLNRWVQRGGAAVFLYSLSKFAWEGMSMAALTYVLMALGVSLLALPYLRGLFFWRRHGGKLKAALHGLNEELGTVERRVRDAQRTEHFAWDFYLPAAEWPQHRDTLSGAGLDYERSLTYDAYERAGALNEVAQQRENNGAAVLPEDDLPGALRAIRTARAALHRRLFGS
jgi:hypothetical protein